jgi:uncharacterized membrane protein
MPDDRRREETDADTAKRCLDVHLAEYNALTMRNTYWITLQYAVYAIAGAYIGFAVQARATIPFDTLMWGSALALLLLGWGILQIQYEIFNNVEYMETKLKPKVMALIGGRTCWEYESFLAELRARGFLRFEWKYALLIIFIFVLMLVGALIIWTIEIGTWTRWDTAWLCADVYVGALVFGRALQNAKVRRRMIAPEKHIMEP